MVTTSTSRAVRVARTIAVTALLLTTAFIALVLASATAGVARGGDSLLYGDPMAVSLQVSSEDVGPMPEGVTLDAWLPARVEIPSPSTSEMLTAHVAVLAPAVVTALALALLASVLHGAARGDAFGAGQARRFRDLGFLLVVGGFVLTAVDYAVLSFFYARVPAAPSIDLAAGPLSPLPVGMLVGGLVAFALAAAFADGASLREDVEGTI